MRVFYRNVLDNLLYTCMSSISVKTNLVENYMNIQAIRVPFLLSFSMTRDAKVAQGFIFLFFYNLSVDIRYDSFEKGSGSRRIQRMCRYSLMPRTEFEVRLSVSGRYNIVHSLDRPRGYSDWLSAFIISF